MKHSLVAMILILMTATRAVSAQTRSRFVAVLVTLVVALLGMGNAARAQFTTLDDPVSTWSTNVTGISGSSVVGYYYDFAYFYDYNLWVYPARGFLYNGSSWAPVDFPGANYGTYPTGVSGTTVVGYYYGGTVYHGFLYNTASSTYTSLDNPAATNGTIVTGISGTNIVGYYVDSQGYRGFLYNGISFTPLDFPGAYGTYPGGVSGSNVVGYFSDLDGVHGFFYNITDSTYSAFDVPGASSTYATGISGGNVVGYCYMGTGQHGFLYNSTSSTVTLLDDPSSVTGQTWPAGISGTNIVGSYNTIFNTPWYGEYYYEPHGFIYNTGHIVLLVHGIFSNHVDPWSDMSPALMQNNYKVETIDFNSAPETLSNEAHIADQALALSNQMPAILEADSPPILMKNGRPTVDLVCHSMGGLAARWYLNHPDLWKCYDSNGNVYSGVRKLIMIATPNLGSDSWVLNPIVSLIAAYDYGSKSATTYGGSQPVDQVGSWSPCLEDMYSEWMVPPTRLVSGTYSYPSTFLLDKWPQPLGSESTGPLSTSSINLADVLLGISFFGQTGQAAIQAAVNTFPKDPRSRFSAHVKYFGQQSALLGTNFFPDPSPAAQVEGVNTRRISDFLWELNVNTTDTSGTQVYLIAGTNPSISIIAGFSLLGPYNLFGSDGVVPYLSVLGIDPITNSSLFPTAPWIFANDNHVNLPHDPSVINQVIQWLGQ